MASIRRRNGKYQVQVRIGKYSTSKSFLLLSDAKEWARNQEIEASGRLFLGRQYQPRNFSEILTRYSKEITPLKRSAKNELIVIKAILRETWTRVDLRHLRTEDLIKWRDQRLTEVKPATIKRQLNIIKHACTVGQRDWNYGTPITMINKLQLPRNPQHLVRRITPTDAQKLFVAVSQCRCKLILPIVRIGLLTGMRLSEILSLRWDDYDITAGWLYIRQTKNGLTHEFPIVTEVSDIIDDLPSSSNEVIFPITSSAVGQAFRRARQRAGLPHIRIHDLRHEAISRFFDFGLTVPEVASLTGHQDSKILLSYAHKNKLLIFNKLKNFYAQ